MNKHHLYALFNGIANTYEKLKKISFGVLILKFSYRLFPYMILAVAWLYKKL